MITLRAFGTLDVRGERGEPLTSLLTQSKRAALFTYLVLSRPGEMHRRDALLALFWPELDQTHGRNALSQSLSFLRRELGDGVLVTRGTEEVGIHSAQVTSDVRAFEDALASEDWAEAVEAYGGDLLEGLHVVGAAPFTDWVDRERERLRESASGAAWKLAHAKIAAGELTEAERVAQRALMLVPTDESPVRGFIEALAGSGDRAAALRFYERFREVLAEELEVEPAPETVAVMEAVRERSEPVHFAAKLRRALVGSSADELSTAAQLAQVLSPKQIGIAVQPAARERRIHRRVASVAVGVGAMAMAVVTVWQHGRPGVGGGPPSPDRPFTVLAATGGSADSVMRDNVAYVLRLGLDMTHVVQTVPSTEIERFLTLMDRPVTTDLDASTARELAGRYGVPTVVLPRVDAVGDGYLVAVRVEDVGSGRLRAAASGRAAGADQVVAAVDEAVRQLARDLGESRPALVNTPRLPEVMTPSLEALRKYREGDRLNRMTDYRNAVVVLREAVALDTAFAEAWAKLSAAYNNLAQDPRYAQYADSNVAAFDRALRFPERLTEWRRYDFGGGDLFRRDVALWDEGVALRCRGVKNCGWVISAFGLLDSALNLEMRALADSVRHLRTLDPLRVIEHCREDGWQDAIGAGRLDEWRAFLDSLGVTTPASCAPRFDSWARLAAGDWNGADSIAALHADLRLHEQDAVRGRIAAVYQAGPSTTEAILLDLVYRRPCVVDEVPLDGRGASAVLGYLRFGVRSALCGDTLDARAVRQRLRAVRDEGTSEYFERALAPFDAVLQAGPALRRHDWTTALGVLRPAAERIREPGYGRWDWGQSYLVWWLLAEAYAGLERPDSAAAYLESVVGSPGLDWRYYGVPYPAAQFRLGQLYGQLGDTARSLEHFTIFLDVFTDPDPEYVWMVEQARTEVTARKATSPGGAP